LSNSSKSAKHDAYLKFDLFLRNYSAFNLLIAFV
jgi:hypothetical protein